MPSAGKSAPARVRETARELLGIERLRRGQLEAVQAVLAGRDTLAVMSTGYGKSAIYQLAGFLIEGPTVIVSPLIALQRDQVEAIEEQTPGEAAQLNSALGEAERRELLGELADGEREFVLLAPEQLANEEVLAAVKRAQPSLLVIDEAHCISEWGHDFRPDYLRLGAFAAQLGPPILLALTATASPPVRREIVRRLGMEDPAVVVRGFDRPEIHLGVRRFRDGDDQREALLAAVEEAERPGIVYVATRQGAESLAQELQRRGVGARHYHAGLAGRARDELQEAFMEDEVDVIVATTAFGMGIDKPNVRFVFHAQMSDSLDSYYQEIGRAGRDDRPARACLFYRPEDQGIRRFLGAGGVGEDELEAVARAVESAGRVDPARLCDELDISQTRLLSALNRLEETGAVALAANGEVEAKARGEELGGAVESAAAAAEERRAFDRSRIEMMRRYAEHDGCRRDFLLSYFGEEHEGACGNCDNCEAGVAGAGEDGERPFPVGAAVAHREWGEGEVQRYDGEQVVVLFESVGYKTLGVDLVLERELLRPA